MPEQPKERVYDLYLVVAIGGVVGALARNAVEIAIPTGTGQWPMATFLVNLTGAFVLGLVLALADVRYPDPKLNAFARRFRPFIITGVLGGYTTFSTFMVETHGLLTADRLGMAVMYVVGSTLLGIACCLLGLLLGSATMRALRIAPTTSAALSAAVDDVVEEDEA